MRCALLVLLVACGRPAPETPGRADAPSFAPRTGGLAPLELGTSDPALTSSAACAGCHAEEHALWAESRHAKAWTNGIFRREYREQPRDWCIHCHAPTPGQVAQAKGAGGALADEGVGCPACHVRDGTIVARRRLPGSPHQTRVSAAFGGAEFCGGCHEFPFPRFGDDGEPVGLTAHPMQATVAQFRAGPFAGAADACHTCHLPHAYPGAHSPEMLAGSVRFAVCRDGDEVEMSVANIGAGHNVPTGDVHRHMLARAWRPSAPERLFEAFIGRRFTVDPAGGKRTTWDSTVAPGATRRWRVRVGELGEAQPGEALAFELRYLYTADEAPRRHRHPGEPTWRTVSEQRMLLEEMEPCTR